MEKLVIIGAGGFGREVAAMVKDDMTDQFELVGFVDDGVATGELRNGIEVLGDLDWLNNQSQSLAVVLAIGDPATKSKILRRLNNEVLSFPNLIHSRAYRHDPSEIKMGKGNIITDRCILTTNIELGSFNLINLAVTVGHDCQIGSFCSIMPGVNIGGGAKIGDHVYVGSGANVIKAVTIGSNCTIGSGAMVNTEVPAGQTYVGVPARAV